MELHNYLHLILRIICTVVMFKRPNICKSFLYLDLTLDIPRKFLPRLFGQDVLWYYINTRLLWCFTVYHFSFWPNFLFSVFYIIVNTAIMGVIYSLPADGTFFANLFSNLTFVVIAMFFINISMKKLGQLHVQAEIRSGGEEVLNGLD